MNNGQKQGMAMLSVEQMIPNPAKQRAQRDSSGGVHSAVERANQQFAYNELRAQAKTLYYEWVVLRKKDAVLTEDEELLRFFKLAQVRYPYNQSGLNSIYEAEARLACTSMTMQLSSIRSGSKILL